ncbi:glycosyltransferase [Schlesneria paludicola]|uniref:glycosyltransferase n=1 Tax=Schlesneria paludicola TaxID=360056 RepID=UPI00029AE9F5|nr:glycosyltransferase [Schlesneria paludicola]
MAKTRIALVIPTLDRSGAEKQFTLLATHLPQDEFDVLAIALTRGGPYESELREADVPLTVIGKRAKFDPFSIWRLRKELRRWQPQIMHSWLFAANAYCRLSSGAVPATKIVVSERCVDSWKAGWQRWLDRRLIDQTDRLIGNSSSVVEFYRELGVPAEKLACVPNGVEVPPLDESANQQARSELLKELGLPPTTYVAGYIGRLAKQKRVEDLIWAVETLRQIRPQLHLVLVGEGPERTRLEEFAKQIGATNHIHFVGHRDDAPRWMSLFDVFCLASSFEGMSNSVMEAMSMGKPVLASDIPANRELVAQGETGFLPKLTDTVGFMQFLRRLIDEPGLGRTLGQAGRERIQQSFSIPRMVSAYADIYRQLLNG